jgi:hypothetical protein
MPRIVIAAFKFPLTPYSLIMCISALVTGKQRWGVELYLFSGRGIRKFENP